MTGPSRVASPGNPVYAGNYRVSVRANNGDYSVPSFAYPPQPPPQATVHDPNGGTAAKQVSLKTGDVRDYPWKPACCANL